MKAPDASLNEVGSLAARSMQEEMDQLMLLIQPLLQANTRNDGLFDDAGETVWDAYLSLRAGFELVRSGLRRRFQSAYKRVSDYTYRELTQVLSIDTEKILPGFNRMRDSWVRESISLIKTSDKLRGRIEKVVLENPELSINGLQQKIREVTDMEVGRARLIARDQTMKAYSRLHQERQQRAGITKYRWVSVLDGRERKLHALLHDTVHDWSNPPVAHKKGLRAHPGAIFQCRCTPEPVLD